MAKARKNGRAAADSAEPTPEQIEHANAQINALIGTVMNSNVSDQRMQEFADGFRKRKLAVKEAQDELREFCKAGEGDGINLPIFKFVEKQIEKVPAEARSNLQTVLRYSRQLSLLDAIEANDQAEAREADAATVGAAEKGAGTTKHQRSFPDAIDQTRNGGPLEAANAQGLQAGLDGAKRDSNPYSRKKDGEKHDYWDRGWAGGDKQRKAAARNGTSKLAADIDRGTGPATAPADGQPAGAEG